ncbi:MAG: insulinase family protein [Gammaproteobacteria bacterium]|nr:insulinase family protein [Gammaproteobacteria bacterium]MDH5304399.1 insulinase family protein [Gammaproteobacteria bacterium]MDH5322098.1 insulinase family protein [Gammaproteobacteria bacterium]
MAAVMRIPRCKFLLLLLLSGGPAIAALDLRNAMVERLENGLTVILLVDRNFPVASVQMLYRVGARDETTGRTGLAHFLEHMAFRDSENFPDSGLTSSITAHGGEWHGYTWIDQTTYFATVPKEHLDLLLRIEADRMTRLEISASDMDAERGAVLAEMHMYENDPASMLIDAVNYLSFLGHPYRNNTIGWQSDIEQLPHADVVEFYRRHYHASNAVLVVAGDIDSKPVLLRIEELFGEFEHKPPTPLPHTIEPLQQGERRIVLHGAAGERQFRIAWRAPAASSPDFAAFLVLQSLLGASSGVNFNQNDWGTEAAAGSILDGVAAGVTTWFPPSAQDYVFVVGGSAPADMSMADIERAIENRIATLRREPPGSEQLAAALDDVLEQMIYDVETTEDAAHQLAFFEGLGALDTLLTLPERVAAVTAADVQRVAARYLLPQRRSIAWYLPQATQAEVPAKLLPATVAVGEKQAIDSTPAPPPVVRTLRAGLPVIVQQTDFSPSLQLDVMLSSGETVVSLRGRSQQLAAMIDEARARLAEAGDGADGNGLPSLDPETRLAQAFGEIMARGVSPPATKPAPALIVVSGDVDAAHTMTLLEQAFGTTPPAAKPAGRPAAFVAGETVVRLGVPIAQPQLGYIVPAAAPTAPTATAQQLLLHILSHGYEGRLGKVAITERGLAYWISSEYRSDGDYGWLTLATGVDQDKLDALRSLLDSELQRLLDEPPTHAEVEQAKAYFVGRARSAAQSNAELAAKLAQQWSWYGETQTIQQLEDSLARISRQDVLDVIPAFIGGTTIVVEE